MPDLVLTIASHVEALRGDLIAFLQKLVQLPSLPGSNRRLNISSPASCARSGSPLK